MSFNDFLQHLSNAVSLGSLYALIAIGYTMVYGILRLINFAHGEIFMIATYITFYAVGVFLMPWWLAFTAAIVITGLLGILVEKIAYRPLRDSPRISVMISAIGVSYFIQNLAVVLFGGRPKAFPIPEYFDRIIVVGETHIAMVTFFIPIVTFVSLAALVYIINRTKVGMAMRAVSKDFDTARLMGIDVNKIVSFSFGIGSVLAAVGGIMWGLKYPNLIPAMGIMPGLKCFIAAVVGGIGSIAGAVIGGLILGVTEIMVVAFFPALSGYRDAFAFIILIVILLVRPVGLLGKNVSEKV